jgi:hypothetical protein
MRIQRTTFPERTCEAARRVASRRRSSFLASSIAGCPQSALSDGRCAAHFAASWELHDRAQGISASARGAIRRGAVSISPRSSELRRGSKLSALDHIRSELSCVLIRCAIEAQQILSSICRLNAFESVCIPSCSSRKQTPRRGWADSCTCCDEYCCGRCLSQELAI